MRSPVHRRRPQRPPFLRVLSEGMGVTSSIRPIFIPERARALRADWAPGPGVLVLFPPVARSLMCRAVMPSSLHLWATSWAANMAAYGEDSSRSAITFILPVTPQMVCLPQRSVTWSRVSSKDAKMWQATNTFPPSATWGPRLMVLLRCNFWRLSPDSSTRTFFYFHTVTEAVTDGVLSFMMVKGKMETCHILCTNTAYCVKNNWELLPERSLLWALTSANKNSTQWKLSSSRKIKLKLSLAADL